MWNRENTAAQLSESTASVTDDNDHEQDLNCTLSLWLPTAPLSLKDAIKYHTNAINNGDEEWKDGAWMDEI